MTTTNQMLIQELRADEPEVELRVVFYTSSVPSDPCRGDTNTTKQYAPTVSVCLANAIFQSRARACSLSSLKRLSGGNNF